MGVPPTTPSPSKMYMVRELRLPGEAGILGLRQTGDRKDLPTSPSVVWKLLPTGCGTRQQDWGLVVFSACLLCLVTAAERTGDRLRKLGGRGRQRPLHDGVCQWEVVCSFYGLHVTTKTSKFAFPSFHATKQQPWLPLLPLRWCPFSPLSTLSFFSLRFSPYFLHSLSLSTSFSSFLPFRTRVNWNQGKVWGPKEL